MHPGRAGDDEIHKYPPANFDRTRPPPGQATSQGASPGHVKWSTRRQNRHDATESDAQRPFATPTMRLVRR